MSDGPGSRTCPLSELPRGASGRVTAIADDGTAMGDASYSTVARRLRELGFVPGAPLTVLARMWPGDEPIAVRIAGATFALRRFEAEKITVSTGPQA
jgi:ferrous iron transport protein A